MKEVKDPFTGEVFFPTRTNQKFANRKNQVAFNNMLARRKRAIMAPINYCLNNNRNVLKKALGDKSSVIVSKDYLLGAGFMFHTFCSSKRTNDGVYQSVYEYAISARDNDKFKIVKL